MSKLRLQETDLTLLALLNNYGYLTTSQLAVCTERNPTSLRKRLKELADSRYLERYQKTKTDEAIWFPTPKTITALVKSGRLENRASARWQTRSSTAAHKEHEVDINRVLLGFERSASDHDGVAVGQFAKGKLLHDRAYDTDGQVYPVRPDALLQLSIDHVPSYFFLEIDRSTEPQKREAKDSKKRRTEVVNKLFGYQLYFEDNGFARKYAGGQVKEHWPFRVLVIIRPRTETDSRGRLYNMIDQVIRDLIKRRIDPPYTTYRGYAMFADVVADPYAPHFLRECDIAPIARYLDEHVAGRTLAEALATDEYEDVLAAIPESLRDIPYKNIKQRRRKHDPIRDTLLDALIATNRLRRYSVLEHWAEDVTLPRPRS